MLSFTPAKYRFLWGFFFIIKKYKMRNTIIILLLFCGSMLSAQITRLPNGDFKQEVSKKATTETKTLNVFIDKEGNKYPIYKGKKGGLYVYRISKKSGKTYRYYLPINKEK